jgi:penicillin-binding protein 1A
MKTATAPVFTYQPQQPVATNGSSMVLTPLTSLIRFLIGLLRPSRLLASGVALSLLVMLSGTPGIIRGFTLPPGRLVVPRKRARILDRRGNLYTHFGSEQIDVDYDDLPQHLVHALLAREDSRFFEHDGVCWWGFGRAVVVNVIKRDIKQGASTFTMQLVEKAYQLPQGGKWNRWQSKFTEWTLASRGEEALEAEVGSKAEAKKRILAAYLNRVEFGHGTVGIGSAARFYFTKQVKDLTLGESAMLAGLLRATSANSPYVNSDNARAARDAVIARMLKKGWISEKDAKSAKFLAVSNPSAPRPKHNGYLPAAIKREINALIKAGELPADFWKHEDLVVHSTLDLWAQEILDSEISAGCSRIDGKARSSDKDRLEGGALLLNNEGGEILALVGGQNFQRQQYDLALMSERQAASIVKPFVYGTYVEAGGSMSDRCSNGSLTPTECRALGGWNPANASCLPVDIHPLKTGLAYSDNYMTIRVGLHVGLPSLRETFARAGLIPASMTSVKPSVLLGTFDASLAEAVSAFSAFPRGGTRVSPRMVKGIELNGRTIYTGKPSTTSVFSRSTCAQVHRGMREAMTNGTGARAVQMSGLRAPVAGKTGTSQNAADAWWVGYVEDVTLGVRFGRDSNRPITSTASGGNVAAPAATRIFKRLGERIPMADAYRAE